MPTATPRLMGAEVKRKEDPRLVTGISSYVDDITIPGLHYVAFVRSPHAHAKVGTIDTTAAVKRAGVFKIVTGQDIRAHCQPIPLGGPSAEGGGGAETAGGRRHYPLSIGRVRHVGEPVAAVIATSQSAAADGAADVVVDWEVLPAVADQLAAMAAGAPQLFEDAPKNIEHETNIKVGEPDAAFAKASKVVKQRMVSQRLCGVPMEPRAALAAPDPASGGVTLWSTHQAPHMLRNDIAACLGLEQNLVRVIAPEVGGGFGVKFGIYPEDVTLAVIAKLFRVPVRWTETRVEHMTSTTHGRAQVTDLEAAVEADGTITAVRMHVIADIGAYPIFTFIPDLTLFMGVGVYKVTNVDLKSTCVFTNSTPVAAYRGAGRPPSRAPRPTARGTRRPSRRSSLITSASSSTRWWCGTATRSTRRWATAPAAAAASPSAAPPSSGQPSRCRRRRAGSPPTCWTPRPMTWSWKRAGTRSRACPQRLSPSPRSPPRPTRKACPRASSTGWRPRTSSARRSSYIPSGRTWPWSRSIATRGTSACATSSRWTTAAFASARCSWPARCTAGWPRGSHRRSWKRWSTTRTASS